MTVLIKTKEAISLLGCSPSVFKGYVHKGNLQTAKKVGGKSYFYKEKILNFTPPRPPRKGRPNMNLKTRFRLGLEQSELLKVIDKWRVNSKDSSSADVQIGIYTEKIKKLEFEMKQTQPEDPIFIRIRYTLLTHVGERRKLLRYLEISDYTRYRRAKDLINEHR